MISIGNPIGPFNTRTVVVDGTQWGLIQLIRKGQYKVKCDRMIWTCPHSGVSHNVKLCRTLEEAKSIIDVSA